MMVFKVGLGNSKEEISLKKVKMEKGEGES